MAYVIDFESYWNSQLTLSKLSTIEYIHQTHVHGVGILDTETKEYQWLKPEAFKLWLHTTKPDHIIGHNLLFDGLMLKELFAYEAAYYTDTISVVRALFNLPSYALKKIAETFQLPQKLEGVDLAKNETLTDEEFQALGIYCQRDCEIAASLYSLATHIPKAERDLIDITVKWALRDTLRVSAKIEDYLQTFHEERQALIEQSGIEESILSSNKQFQAYLESQGYDIPMKVSLTTGKEAPAFGKTDQAWRDAPIPDHIKAGREAAKSTIGISRSQRFKNIYDTSPNHRIPVIVQYRGAHSSRWAGRDYNLQNLASGSNLRKALVPPPEHKLVVADSSQIELRMNLWFCGHMDELNILADGKDLYKETAADIYHVPIDQVTKAQRLTGKIATLGAGYGMGWQKFHTGCNSGALNRGVPIPMTEQEAQTAIKAFRRKFFKITNMWKTAEDIIHKLAWGIKQGEEPYTLGPVTVRETNYLELPPILDDTHGALLHYPNLEEKHDGTFWYGHHRLTGPKMVQNIIQPLARQVIAEQVLVLERQGIPTACTVHDEIICTVPEQDAQRVLDVMIEVMSTPPKWAPTLRLGAEGHIADNYAEAK